MTNVVAERNQLRGEAPHLVFAWLETQGRKYVWLANRLGVSKQLISDIKHGRRSAPAGFTEQACLVLGVPQEALMVLRSAPAAKPWRQRRQLQSA